MDKLLIIDGSNLLFQMFYGMPARIFAKDGRPIHGTIGFVGALIRVIRSIKPTHAAAIFDGENPSERSALYGMYKANRTDYSGMKVEDTPFSQLKDIYSALDALNIKHAETCGCETDDIIAAYAHRYGEACEIVIMSFDSDYFQLITKNVTVLRYRGKNTTLCTEEYILERYGIRPGDYADFKSLTGDSAYNIKGACKVGPKTAAELINSFGGIDDIIAAADMIKKPSIRESIIKSGERLKLNKRLIRLDGGHALPFEKEALVFHDMGQTSTRLLKELGVL